MHARLHEAAQACSLATEAIAGGHPSPRYAYGARWRETLDAGARMGWRAGRAREATRESGRQLRKRTSFPHPAAHTRRSGTGTTGRVRARTARRACGRG